VKYNKSNKNLQGNLNIIYRAGTKVYQVKATSMSSLSINTTNPCSRRATFTSKANLIDISNPALPISIYGGITLQVNMTDNGDPGTNDKIGITLLNGNNLVYSSNWVNTQTIEQLLNSGNLEVHNGITCTAPTMPGNIISLKGTEVIPEATGGFEVKASPNPSTTDFNIQVISDSKETIQVKLLDVSGKTIGTFINRFATMKMLIPGRNLRAGTYFAEVTQGTNRHVVKLVKLN
jgi:hypothetical protein